MKTKKIVKTGSKKMSVVAPSKGELKYEKDFYKWTQDQSKFLQKGEFSKLDIDHLREEIESLGISLQRALESYLSTLLTHKLKIKYQSSKHTNSWDNTIKNCLFQIEKLIKKNPSLITHLNEIFKDAYYTGRLEASSQTGLKEDVFPEECPWKIQEVLPFLKQKRKSDQQKSN